jgi:hypothetical protein
LVELLLAMQPKASHTVKPMDGEPSPLNADTVPEEETCVENYSKVFRINLQNARSLLSINRVYHYDWGTEAHRKAAAAEALEHAVGIAEALANLLRGAGEQAAEQGRLPFADHEAWTNMFTLFLNDLTDPEFVGAGRGEPLCKEDCPPPIKCTETRELFGYTVTRLRDIEPLEFQAAVSRFAEIHEGGFIRSALEVTVTVGFYIRYDATLDVRIECSCLT